MPTLLAIAPADAQALTLVAILAFALGSLVTLFVVMARNGRRNEALDLPEFPDLENESPPALSSRKSPPPRADWERESDWWKKG
ncbi:hypothetical protein [Roseibacillus ishigakijimensis]|uniref:Uncharacterized protein n=1 Tax=Roseibacillus ishigakijimensis TaxID=454146 RepID=A0A934RPS9_9BACT|nr:hypothetical protein [Roseibacillus ishigakijimensis]MBK1835259.1 hypothetical protein [Roseibacillus ishigakijimensis]